MRIAIAVSSFSVLSLVAVTASADVAPPDDYVEGCTVAKKQTAATECVQCQTVREMYPDAGRCKSLLSPYCFVKVCGAWGGASYPEVWCRTKAASAPAVPAEVTSQLTNFGPPDLSVVNGVAAESCAPYTVDTGTASATSTAATSASATSSTTAATSASATSSTTAVTSASATATTTAATSASATSSATAATSASATGTTTGTAGTSQDSDGCTVSRGGSAAHAGALALATLAAVGISVIRRRSRKR